MVSLLKVKDLTTRLNVRGRQVKVVDQASFTLERGKTLALVGESGCGKSMTALTLMQLIPKEILGSIEGEVLLEGENLLKASTQRLRLMRGSTLSMIFQNPGASLNPVYTIGDQMREVLYIHEGIEEEEASHRVVNALEEVGIPSPKARLDCYPHQLSGGMLQRAMIAMALLLKPKILIADEPTTALDVTVQAQVLDLMRSLQKEFGMAILLITHDMGVVAEMADDVMVMYATQGIEHATSAALFDQPLHPYTQGLFAARPRRGGVKKRFEAIKGFVPEIDNLPTGCHFHPRCPHKMDKCVHGAVPSFVQDKSSVNCWLYEPTRKL